MEGLGARPWVIGRVTIRSRFRPYGPGRRTSIPCPSKQSGRLNEATREGLRHEPFRLLLEASRSSLALRASAIRWAPGPRSLPYWVTTSMGCGVGAPLLMPEHRIPIPILERRLDRVLVGMKRITFC